MGVEFNVRPTTCAFSHIAGRISSPSLFSLPTFDFCLQLYVRCFPAHLGAPTTMSRRRQQRPPEGVTLKSVSQRNSLRQHVRQGWASGRGSNANAPEVLVFPQEGVLSKVEEFWIDPVELTLCGTSCLECPSRSPFSPPSAGRAPAKSGAQGTVLKGLWGELEVAIKVAKERRNQTELIHEARILWYASCARNPFQSLLAQPMPHKCRKLRGHPNIVKFYGASMVLDRLALVLEWLPFTLEVPAAKPMPWCPVALCRGVVSGLQHVHQHSIAHADIKRGNVLVRNSTLLGLGGAPAVYYLVLGRGRWSNS
jgi:serine/threonine protein kinase